jgi:hypothetical protein
MSLLKTKPLWAPTAVATSLGWQDPVTKEVYVSIRGLDARLAAEFAKEAQAPVIEIKEPVVADFVANTDVVVIKEKVEEVITENQEIKAVEIKVGAKRGPKPKQKLDEVVEQPVGLQVIGEVVEQPVGLQVIGE